MEKGLVSTAVKNEARIIEVACCIRVEDLPIHYDCTNYTILMPGLY